jgi:hypothetical protein
MGAPRSRQSTARAGPTKEKGTRCSGCPPAPHAAHGYFCRCSGDRSWTVLDHRNRRGFTQTLQEPVRRASVGWPLKRSRCLPATGKRSRLHDSSGRGQRSVARERDDRHDGLSEPGGSPPATALVIVATSFPNRGPNSSRFIGPLAPHGAVDESTCNLRLGATRVKPIGNRR